MNGPVSIPHMLQAFSSTPPGLPLIDPVGVGLRSPHYQEILDTNPKIGWVEVHPENYFCGGVHRHFLDQIAKNYPISLHGVGLSLGSDQSVDENHLRQFKELIDRYNPFSVSDHVSWSASGNAHLNDLLPLHYTQETLARLKKNISPTQNYFERKILIETPSTYIAFKNNIMPEYEFMNLLCQESGCHMLLDINNIYVQSHNHNLDPYEYIDNIEPRFVREIHMAGHIEKKIGDHSILVDTHNQTVCDDVWKLYDHAIKHLGTIPTLIEWDQDFPPLQTLIDEAETARGIIESNAAKSDHHAVK
ncbi:MAG: DUF692 domain-containing protein [Proteobacteria bacterium]|nr:DUF692 domain-containing protein [Pseudomonadota bacterium]